MSTREAMSHAALGWVKPELDQTLLQMRQQIQDYVEEPGNGQPMLQAAAWLHQVQGTLRMVELYAPALVAEELELLAHAVHQGAVADAEEACAVLMRGTVLLPDYLERLQDGHRDIPIVLLPLLNEIRAARGAEVLNESVLLAFGPEVSDISAEELEHARGSLAGRNRELLSTVGGVVKEELLRIKDALDLHLRTGAPSSALQAQVNQLGAVADTLAMMGLDGARELVLGQRKALVEVVEKQSNIDEDLLLEIAGALLYVDASLDEQVASLGSLGRREEDPVAIETQRTLEVLAAEAITNFAHAREHFVAFIETNWDHSRLADVPRLLGDVAGALRILEMDEPAQYVTGVQRYIQTELIGRLRVPSGRQLDTLADAMASLEYFLEGVRERRPGGAEILEISRSSLQALRYWPLPEMQDATVPASSPAAEAVVAPALDSGLAADTGLQAVAAGDAQLPVEAETEAEAEAEAEMPRAAAAPVPDSVAVSASALPPTDDYPYVFAASHQLPPNSHSPFDPVNAEREEFDVVTEQPLAILPLELEATADALSPPLTDQGQFQHFDPLLAEHAAAPLSEPVAIAPLDGALLVDDLQALELGDEPPAYSGRGQAVEDELRTAALPAVADSESVQAEVSLDAGASVITPQALDWNAEEAAFFSSLDDSALALPAAGVAAAPPAEAAAPAVPNQDGFQDNGQLVDADTLEIREVFLEEFDEELANLRSMLPAWSANPGQAELLLPVRRIFHTLKGSGRLVGARTLGEFSWAIESMLNRVRDGLRPASPAVVAMVTLAVEEVLPQLYAALQAGSVVTADLMAIQGVADRIAAGEEIHYIPAARPQAASADTVETAAVPALESEPLLTVVEGTPAQVDSVLLDILQAEVTTHLATLHTWLAACEQQPQPVDESLLRAVHTMSGAFAMTEVPEITAVTGPGESLVKRLLATAEAPSLTAIAALSGAAQAISQTLQALQAEHPLIPRFSALSAQLQAQVDLLPEARNPLIGSDEGWESEQVPPGMPDLPAEPLADTLVVDHSASLVVGDMSAYIDDSGLQLPDFSAIDAMVNAAGQELLASGQAPELASGTSDAAEPVLAHELADVGLEPGEDTAVSEASLVDAVAEPEVPAGVMELAEVGDTQESVEDAVASEPSLVGAAAELEVPAGVVELAEADETLERVEDAVASEPSLVDAVAELEVPAGVVELVEAGDTQESVEDTAASEASLVEVAAEPEVPAGVVELVEAGDTQESVEDTAASEASLVDAVAELEVPAGVMELAEAGDTQESVEDTAASEASLVDAVAELEVPAGVMELAEAGDTQESVEDTAASEASLVDAVAELEVPAGVMELAEAGDTQEPVEDTVASEPSLVDAVGEPEAPAGVMELAEAGDTQEPLEDTAASEAPLVDAVAEPEVPAGVVELAEAGDTQEPVEDIVASEPSLVEDGAAPELLQDAAPSEPLLEQTVVAPEAAAAGLEPAADDVALAPAGQAPSLHFELEPSSGEVAAPVEPAVELVAGDEAAADAAALDFQVLDLELVDIFVEEGKDLLDHCDGLLADLRSNPDDREAVAGLQRDLHTLKGGARMAGINPVGDLAHTVESLLEAVVAERLSLGDGEVRLLENGFDHLHRMVTRTGEHLRVDLPAALVEAFEARTQGLELQFEQASVVSDEATHQASHAHEPDEPVADTAAVADHAGVAAVAVEEAAPLVAADQVESAVEAEAEAEADVEAEQATTIGRVITIAGVLDEHDEHDAPVEPALDGDTVQAQAPAAVPQPATPPSLAATEPAAVLAVSGPVQQAPAPTGVAAEPLSAPVDDDAVAGEDGTVRAGQEQVRVRADLLDRLVGHAGEVAIYRSRLEQQLGAFRGAMAELDRTNARLRDQLRRLDLETEAQIVARYQREQDSADRTFDPLELDRFSTLQQLSRALNESAADLSGLQGVLDDLARNYDNLLSQQSRVSSELQDGLMRARMVPFDGLVPRLRRVVRQAAADSGKSVRLVVEGTQGELDRSVLDRMVAPLEHMLRNSVAHGIETAPVRLAAGKPEEGVITLQLRREGSEIALEVTDDGAGLDRSAIRRRAEQRGLIKADDVLSEHELDSLIFAAGFTTADQVSQLAGRGVGMDVVRNEVRQLGGSVDVHSESGRGARFVMRLPQTLAVTQAVFAQIGETTYAVPVASVSGIGRIARERFENGDGIYRYGGEEYALHDLGLLVGQGPAKAEGQAQVPLLLVRAGDLRAAVAIDQVVGNREVVVKPVGMQIASVPGIYGATITGEGNVVVILDVAPLVRRQLNQPSRTLAAAPAVPVRQVPLVMVVDDSLTMRKVTGRVLERHNFEVSAARDGIEALEQLAERVPDLMLLDIEMPRMDGYELATAMRADPRYKDVPIIMITSRTGDKHRQRALEIGVQRYLGKPYQEPELMRNVYDLLGISRARD